MINKKPTKDLDRLDEDEFKASSLEPEGQITKSELLFEPIWS